MGRTKDNSIILTFTIICVLTLAGMVLAGGLSTPGYYTITLPDGNQRFLTSISTSGSTTMHIQGFLMCDQTGTCAAVDANGRLQIKGVIVDVAGNDLDLAQRGTVHSANDHGVILAGLTSAGTYSLIAVRSDGAVLSYGTSTVGISDGTNKMTLEQHTSDGESGADWGFPVESYNVLLNVSGTWDRMRSVPTTSDAVSGSYIGHAGEAGLNYGFNGSTWDRLRVSSGTPTIGLATSLAMQSAATNTPVGSVSLGNATGKTNYWKVGSLVSTAVTADQVCTNASQQFTAGKQGYLIQADIVGRLTSTPSTTSWFYGTASLENPFGTKIKTIGIVGPPGTVSHPYSYVFSEPALVSAGATSLRWVVTPSNATSMTWYCNFHAYEK